MNPYGYCPVCGARCKLRERRMGGNDTCKNGHVYPSRDAVKRPPVNSEGLAIANVEQIQAAAVDPDSPMYGSDCVDWVLDLCEHVKDVRTEIESVLLLMDGLAEHWGDEGVFRRCRDRLRALVRG